MSSRLEDLNSLPTCTSVEGILVWTGPPTICPTGLTGPAFHFGGTHQSVFWES